MVLVAVCGPRLLWVAVGEVVDGASRRPCSSRRVRFVRGTLLRAAGSPVCRSWLSLRVVIRRSWAAVRMWEHQLVPRFGRRPIPPSEAEREAAAVDLDRIKRGGIPLGAEQRLKTVAA